MKKIYTIVILLLIFKSIMAQVVMLPPQNLEGLNPDLTDYISLSWEAPALISTTKLNKEMLADTISIENLSGYNIYRDSVLIATVDATTLQYFDFEPVFLFTNEYHVSALYDLSDYGFPGESGESLWEGPIFATVIYCGCQLPFIEEFSTGLFSTNQWETSNGNWQISSEEGNQAPCAKFNSIPLVSDYSQSVTSYWLMSSNSSDIFLDFDLKLITNGNDSTEKLYVDVLRSSVWTNVAVYKNTQSTEWDQKSINITNQAYGDYFKFRFRAEGINTSNILHWLIDNIHVYNRCPVPGELTADFDGHGTDSCWVKLSWNTPVINNNVQIQGYNIYRDNILLQQTNDTIFYDLYYGYCYKVTTLLTDCESDFSNEVCPQIVKDPCPTAVNQIDLESASIYPNPASSTITLTCSKGFERIEIFNLLGTSLISYKLKTNEQHIPLNIASLKNGIYLVKFTGTNTSTLTIKFLVQK